MPTWRIFVLTDFKMKETKGTRLPVHHTQPLSETGGGSAQTQVQITSVSRGTSESASGEALSLKVKEEEPWGTWGRQSGSPEENQAFLPSGLQFNTPQNGCSPS